MGRILRARARQLNTSFEFNFHKGEFMVSMGHLSEVSSIPLAKQVFTVEERAEPEADRKINLEHK